MSKPYKTTAIIENPLIAVVCDIRGFTDFTSTVDSVNRSDHVPDHVKPRLLKKYDELVRQSQEAALREILGPMAEELRRNNSELAREWIRHSGQVVPLPCALKSTGDGFLVAVELVHNDAPVKEELQRALAVALTRGVTNLVREAKEGGQFRKNLFIISPTKIPKKCYNTRHISKFTHLYAQKIPERHHSAAVSKDTTVP